ncbi:MAG: DNA-3-methyladenine glycosylase 2 family protein [Acidimicrobiia bacterium]|nr:DNA-3-methyladenine glycosylase 2 family protein [Acidimicrobiia bacterium]
MRRAARIEADIERLADDPELGRALDRTGPISVRLREPGFGTLLHLVLEQQISIDAARTMYERLVDECGGTVAPEAVLALDDATMRACGFTRQKTAYARDVARRLLDGSLDLERLGDLPGEEADAILNGLHGVGPWTADTYRLWALGERDVFPRGDLALALGWQEIAGLAERPASAVLDAIALRWRPRRSAAAMIVWHHYLATRGRQVGAP